MSKRTKIDDRQTGTPSAPPATLWRRRYVVLLAAVVLLLVLVLVLAGASSMIALSHLIADGFLIAIWLLAAAGYGAALPLPLWERAGVRGEGCRLETHSNAQKSAPLTPHPKPLPQGERGRSQSLGVVTALAIGMGVISLLQLGLGLAGLIDRVAGIGVIVIGLVLLVFRCRRLRRDELIAWANAPADWEWLWLLAVPALAIAIVAALVPPGILWGDEPNGYDVLEYHLQLPREWFELHRIVPLHHNVFSYFPLGMEMNYLLAMQLRGGPWAGMYAATMMHVATCALTIAAIYAVARQFAGKLPATLAAVAAANVPWMMLLAPVAYNEGGLLLFGTLAIGWLLRAVGATLVSPSLGGQEGETSLAPTWRTWAIAGLTAGFACGVKLTAVPQVLIIVPLIVGVAAFIRRRSAKSIVVGILVYGITGLFVFSPWLIRNAVWTHNPVFPEAQDFLGRAHFSETQWLRWDRAHTPRQDQKSPSARHAEAWRQIAVDPRYGYILWPAALLCALIAIQRPPASIFLALAIVWLIFWLSFTHLQGRFYVLTIPLAALAIALMQSRWQLVLAGSLTLVIVISGLAIMADSFAKRVTPIAGNGWLGITDLSNLLPEDVAAVVAKQEPIALVGDAKAFLYQLPSEKLHYRTVFDVDVKPGQRVVDAWVEGANDDSLQMVIDPAELDRFSRTYFGIPPLPDDYPGPRDRPSVIPPLRR